jgi:hypothetical protein
MTSLLMSEAAYLGKPVLSIVPKPDEVEWLSIIRTGQARCAKTRGEVQQELLAVLSGEVLAAPALPDPSGALDRTAAFLEGLVRRRPVTPDPS